MVTSPSGEQFAIGSGPHQVTLVEVGGGIREYTNGERRVLDGYGATEMCSGARGVPLIPWPNRIADGSYEFEGSRYQLALTEPARNNAIHGLLRWRNWRARSVEPNRAVLGSVLHPEPGYPFVVDVSVEYAVHAEATGTARRGLTVTTTATNLGETACPFASGQHPYLAVGPDGVDQASVLLPADTWLPTDERGLPTGRSPVAGTPLDFRAARLVGPTAIDHAYTDLTRDENGLAWLVVTAPDGNCTRVWVDRNYEFLQLFTGDTLAADRRRRSLAVEPMTCPPNGFRSGDGLLSLAPGETVVTQWGIETD